LNPPGSGIGVYAEFPNTNTPSLVGFVSWAQGIKDELPRQSDLVDKDMDDEGFTEAMKLGKVAFFGIFQLPPELSANYEIVSVPEPAIATN
jgi:hypothetical protein